MRVAGAGRTGLRISEIQAQVRCCEACTETTSLDVEDYGGARVQGHLITAEGTTAGHTAVAEGALGIG